MNANYDYATIRNLAGEIMEEAHRAGILFPPMHSPHEAEAVIREEFDEYWDEVKKHNTSKPDRDTRPRQREELIQLAAMCVRAIIDTIDAPLAKPNQVSEQNGFSENFDVAALQRLRHGCSECPTGFGESTQVCIDAAQAALRANQDDSPSGGCI
jgi:hypothetical protein